MIKEFKSFTIPANSNTVIWRYMDLAKFVSLLGESALFFPRASTFDDPTEGSLSDPTALREWRSLDPLVEAVYKAKSRELRKFILISCWSISKGESAVLWKCYAPTRQGIAVRSSIAHLKQSLQAEPQPIYLGQVQYIDFKIESMSEPVTILSPFGYKQKPFDDEKEFRAFFVDPRFQDDKRSEEVNRGEYISVDLESLIDEIVVSGTPDQWFLKLVQSIVDRYGLKKPCRESELARAPVF